MLPLDLKYGRDQIRQFASQLEHVSPEMLSNMEEGFAYNHSTEFYEGLLTGYANMYQILSSMSPETAKEYTGVIVAFVADHLNKKFDKMSL